MDLRALSDTVLSALPRRNHPCLTARADKRGLVVEIEYTDGGDRVHISEVFWSPSDNAESIIAWALDLIGRGAGRRVPIIQAVSFNP